MIHIIVRIRLNVCYCKPNIHQKIGFVPHQSSVMSLERKIYTNIFFVDHKNNQTHNLIMHIDTRDLSFHSNNIAIQNQTIKHHI